MALPTYPPSLPTASTVKMAERGQQNYFFINLQAITTTTTVGYGNGFGAPVGPQTSTQTGPIVFGIPAAKLNEAFGQDYTIEIDAYGLTVGSGPTATVVMLGSLDGVQFYQLASAAVSTTGTIFSLAKSVSPGLKVRYLTAAVVAYGGVGSTFDSVTGSFIF
jgi:hypothetical protein